MIDEPTEELASLDVLGLLEGEEARAFQERLRTDPELGRLVAELEAAAAALAKTTAPMAPPAAVRQRILSQIQTGKVVAMPAAPRTNWLPWALAACLAILAGALAWDRAHLKSELSAARDHDELSQIRIATLASLAQNAPKGVAVVAWDSIKQQGIIKVQDMPMPRDDQDYQLWVIDPQVQAAGERGARAPERGGDHAGLFQARPTDLLGGQICAQP